MRRCSAVILLLLLIGCTSIHRVAAPVAEVAGFSANQPGAQPPWGWEPLIISRAKAPTEYALVLDPSSRAVVLRAWARSSATGLKQRLDVDPQAQPRVAWHWRVVAPIAQADNTDRHAEDSPVRLLLFFDGNKTTLAARDQIALDLAQTVSGQSMPYATLMYIWENRQPVGTVIRSAHTSRIKMLVAGSGTDRIGQWKAFERNYVDDFQRAFGEPPGRLIGIGVMTDTDNTGSEVEAFYGDIELRPMS